MTEADYTIVKELEQKLHEFMMAVIAAGDRPDVGVVKASAIAAALLLAKGQHITEANAFRDHPERLLAVEVMATAFLESYRGHLDSQSAKKTSDGMN